MQGSGESVRSVAMIPNMHSDPDILRVGHLLADAARAAILPHFRQADLIADNKFQSGYDPITEADRAAERAMRDILAREVGRRSSSKCNDIAFKWITRYVAASA